MVLTWPPEGTGRWELYDIQSDPAEAVDISLDYPDLTKELINDWIIYAKENGIILEYLKTHERSIKIKSYADNFIKKD